MSEAGNAEVSPAVEGEVVKVKETGEKFEEDIKDYAKSTMNELLGMFGYEKDVSQESVDELNLKGISVEEGGDTSEKSEDVPDHYDDDDGAPPSMVATNTRLNSSESVETATVLISPPEGGGSESLNQPVNPEVVPADRTAEVVIPSAETVTMMVSSVTPVMTDTESNTGTAAVITGEPDMHSQVNVNFQESDEKGRLHVQMPTPPSKPLTAYRKFSRMMMGQIRGENPNLSQIEIGKKVSEKWESLLDADRKKYEDEYEIEKNSYHKRMQRYYESEEYQEWYKVKGMPGLQITYDGSEKKVNRIHTSGTEGVCNWCKQHGALQDFSSHDGVREIFIAGLCSARCFELASRRVRDNEEFSVVGHFDESKITLYPMPDTLNTLRLPPKENKNGSPVDVKVDTVLPLQTDGSVKTAIIEVPARNVTLDESPTVSVPAAIMLQNNPNSNFNWEKYLQEADAEAAPWACFKQARTPPHNGFKLGMKLEVTDPRNVKTTCIATVVGILGSRIRCRFDGTDSQNDVWRMVDDKEIHPVGWCEGNGGILQPPVGFKHDAGRFSRVIVKSLASAELAPVRLFKREPQCPKQNFFKKGMKLEAVDPKNAALICVASVAEVEGDMIRVDFDGYLGSDYRCRYDSRDLFPVGWCYFSGYPLQPPGRSKKALLKQAQMAKQQKDKSKQETSTSSTTTASASNSPPSSASSSSQKPLPPPPVAVVNCTDPSETLASSANTVQLYINQGCQGGQYLLPDKVAELPSLFQGTVAAVVKDALQSIVNCAKDQKVVLGFLKPGQGKTIIYAKSGKQTIKCCLQNVDRVSIFWRVMERFSDNLRCCENLFCGSKRLKFQCPKCGGSNAGVDRSTTKPSKPTPSVRSSPASSSTSSHSANKRRKATSPTSEEPPGKRAATVTSDEEAISCPQICSTSPPNTWSVDEVVKYIEGSDLAEFTELFKKHEIDGKALLLLTRDMITSYMGLKLGPAIKLLSYIDGLKQIQPS